MARAVDVAIGARRDRWSVVVTVVVARARRGAAVRGVVRDGDRRGGRCVPSTSR